MSVAPNPQDRWLEIHQLLPALIDQGLVPADLALPANSGLHPLECIASQGPSLEMLTEWLPSRLSSCSIFGAPEVF